MRYDATHSSLTHPLVHWPVPSSTGPALLLHELLLHAPRKPAEPICVGLFLGFR